MTLHLVVDNTKYENDISPTCRRNCELFDHTTGQCGINHEINADDPYLAARCGDMIFKDEKDDSFYLSPSYDESNYILTEEQIDFEDEAMFFDFNGEHFDEISSTYPNQPDYPANREDAIWYVSSCESYGCWIINKSKRFLTVTSKEAKVGWNKNVYQSPYPLHNHNTELSLSSRMAWLVDEQGYGRYVILSNGKIAMDSYPKPENWNNK